MKVWHHPGRIGDCVYALWTMKALGGGKLIVSDYHHPNWSLDIARSMERFLLAQPYIQMVEFKPYAEVSSVDYDFHDAETDYNPEAFPEWRGESWPGNCHIAKRYAIHYGLMFDGKPWLTIPTDGEQPPIAFHAPDYRMIRSARDWRVVLQKLGDAGYKTAFLNAESDLLTSAIRIQSAKLMLGAVSCCHAIAEGLDKPRLVEQASGCFNVNPTLCLNGMSNEAVVAEVKKYLESP